MDKVFPGKTKMRKRSIVDLPEDLLVEILSRVSTVTSIRLRSTSKAMKALITDERFAKKHFTNAPKQSLIIMLIASRVYLLSIDLHKIHNNKVNLKPTSHFSLKDPLSNYSKEVDIRKIFHCADGLLLCTTKDNRLVVWNPCSSEIKWIQPRDSYNINDVFVLGKSSCNKYKILRMDKFKDEIYDFTSNSWRILGEQTRKWSLPGTSVNGNTYWLANSTRHLYNMSEIFLRSFDFSTERFASVSLPGDPLSYRLIGLSVTIEDQKLCLLTTQGLEQSQLQDIYVWIATKIESTGAASWIKFLSVGVAHIERPFCFCTGLSFLVDQENKVLVCCGKNAVSSTFLNVVGEDKSILVDHHDEESICSLVISYVPTLVQIQ